MKKTMLITAAAVGALFLTTTIISCNRESKAPTTVTPATNYPTKSLQRAMPWDKGHITRDGGFIWIGDYIQDPTTKIYNCYPSQNCCHADLGVTYTQNDGVITLPDGTSGLNTTYDGSSDHFPVVYSYDGSNLIFVADISKMPENMVSVYSGDVLTLTSVFHLSDDVVSYYQSVNVLPAATADSGTPNTISTGHYPLYQDGNLAYFMVPASSVHAQ